MVALNPQRPTTAQTINFGQNEEASGSHPFASQLAPVYGALDSGACKNMDHELEVMVEATTQLLRAPAYHKLAWSTLSDQMMQNSLIEPVGDERCSTKALVEDAGSSFRFQDVQEPSTRHEIYSSFVNLIGDSDVVNATWIKLDSLADSINVTGAAITKLSNNSNQNTLRVAAGLDIGILRYPDISEPYYKIYCIKIDVCSATEGGAVQTASKNSIIFEYRWRNFKPRTASLQVTVNQTQEKAVEEAEKLFL